MDDGWNDAMDSLAAVRQGRERLIAAADCPPSRHLAFAAVIGGYVATPALPMIWRMAALVALLVSVVSIVRWDKRRTGMFISGYRAGRTRRLTFELLAVVLPMYVLGSWMTDERGVRWPALAMAPVAAILAYAMSIRWMRVFRGEMLGA